MSLVALITGSSGFCGRHLTARLSGTGLRLVGTGRNSMPSVGNQLHDYLSADLSVPTEAERLVRTLQPDRIFHLAGKIDGTAADIYASNLMASIHLLEAVRLYAPQARVLLIGSAAEYGPIAPEQLPIVEDQPCSPTGQYGLSKLALTQSGLHYSRCYGLRIVIARPFNIVGAGVPDSLVAGAVLRQVRAALGQGDGSLVLRTGNLDAQRDFIAVGDVVDAYARLLEGEHWGQVFNICSGEPTPIRALVDMLVEFSRRPFRIEVDPALVSSTDVPVSYGSWQKAGRAFGFRPTISLSDSLRDAWEEAIRGVTANKERLHHHVP